MQIICSNKGNKIIIPWYLKENRVGNGTEYAQGVSSSDLIYLMIADRFSNGDLTNDKIEGMRDQSLNRDSLYHRHGGDIQGIINHVDYLKDLGVTSLWLLPVVENDMFGHTEHGYAATDHYKIDARLGTTDKYKELSDKLHQNKMKLIWDIVYNHFGLYHFLFQDAPSKDWFHQWPSFTSTSSKNQTIFDPYASLSDHQRMVDGWFVPEMPDVNHGNEFMSNYIIQNALWYVQEFGIDGIRVDTYMYNDLEFANRCNAELMEEYPQLTIFGECMVNGTVNQAYFTENNLNLDFKSNLHGVVDFQLLFEGIRPSLTEQFSWSNGVNKLYQTLSNDILYQHPMTNVLLLDNHDVDRFYSFVGENPDKQKMGYLWLLTCRGIPQIYYGSEVLMKGFNNPDGWLRLDFPGGWSGDSKNAFSGKGLTPEELSTQQLVKKMANFRKTSSAIKTGNMMQYIPIDGVYVYFRYDDNQTIMCVMNTNETGKEIDFSNYAERTIRFTAARNIISEQVFPTAEKAQIPATTMWVLELEKK